MEIFPESEPEGFFDFDPDDQLRTCEHSAACTFLASTRAELYDHYRTRHNYPIYGGGTQFPNESYGHMEVGRDGWDSDEVWQNPDFWARGYDPEWWDHALITENSGQSITFSYEPKWEVTRLKLVELWNKYGIKY